MLVPSVPQCHALTHHGETQRLVVDLGHELRAHEPLDRLRNLTLRPRAEMSLEAGKRLSYVAASVDVGLETLEPVALGGRDLARVGDVDPIFVAFGVKAN